MKFEFRDRLYLANGYWLQKSSEHRWQIGLGDAFLGISIDSNVPIGSGGSIDDEIHAFANAMMTKG